MSDEPATAGLQRNAVGLWNIVFFVVAAASPLASMLGSVPPAFALGNGVGVPSAFVLAGVILVLFSVGYARMSRHVTSAGAFFAFVSKGLGPGFGCGGVALTMVGYHAIQCALYCMSGLFIANLVRDGTGIELSWGWYALLCGVAVAMCGRRNVEFSGRLLGILMLGEVLILFVLNVAILIQKPGHVTFGSFTPEVAVTPGLGIALAFAMSSFAGFEATAIFAEEARDPVRTIPRAAYLSIVLIAVFYGYTTWSAIQGYGESAVVQAARARPDTFWFDLCDRYLGHGWTRVMNGLLLTSIFASILAFHNTITRYLYALGKCGLLPSALARVHPTFRSPHVATLVQSGIAAAVTVPFMIARADPYRTIIPWTNTTASSGLLLVEILVSVAVVRYFRRSGEKAGLWAGAVAPSLAALLLLGSLVFLFRNLRLLAGTDSPAIDLVRVGIVGVLVAGLGYGWWLKTARPEGYARLRELLQDGI